jgi:L-amino acid N-acyltransferase
MIRHATLSDAPAILEIYNDAIINTTAVYRYEPETLQSRIDWIQERQSAGFPIFVLEQAGQVVGFSSYGTFRTPPAYQRTCENSIFVHPNWRGQGVGKHLMPPLIEAARANRMHAMVAGVEATNEASIRFHARFGFERVAHFKEVGFKFGRWLDLVFMELLL